MNPQYTRITSVRSVFRNTQYLRNPTERDFVKLEQKSLSFRRHLREIPRSHLRINGKLVGKEQALDYLAIRGA